MIKKVLAAVALIVLITVAIVQAMEKKEEPVNNSTGIAIGSKAPDFEVKTLTGETVKLSDYKGKKVMLNFWATWCPPCKAEMPDMQKHYEQGHKDYEILAINIDPQLDVQGFVDEMGLTFPILLDEDDSINTKYKVISIPTTYFIDKKGIIREKFTGAMPLEAMEEYLEEL
ncbi:MULTISPECIES: peroxiredoxin [unclassified Bacillus (in: firmicutes)]|uniref:peroxiredoxin family protein n=1 Tax=unclassified Bacillus (in: firmicutes) TaxID=185979 RepID=UPI0008E4FDE9|nr:MULTISPECIES: redoxin domain-containing protein [unclassified Bacillus (in: firmicutes)]SFA89012.1 Peroxiredoxin [Bacillus sp. UNCCL13]SFQ84767.1 Peroxiredoxin [Bacillus sp. cl95]